MKVLLATTNHGKLEEFRRIYGDLGIEIVGADEVGVPEVEETGETFEENAILKAHAGARASGLVTLADDSGLEVDALGGAPGVRSARYAGATGAGGGGAAANLQKLLGALEAVPDEQRTARFRCVLALVDPGAPDEPPVLASGACEGRIARAPRGAGGFGYDPVFVPAGHEATISELDDREKDALSHRGLACARMRPALERLASAPPDRAPGRAGRPATSAPVEHEPTGESSAGRAHRSVDHEGGAGQPDRSGAAPSKR